MDLVYDGKWMELARNHVQWQALVLAMMNRRVLLPDCQLIDTLHSSKMLPDDKGYEFKSLKMQGSK